MASEKLIRDETIEYIARDIGDMMSGERLVKKLISVGVPPEIIIYPNTKWRMIFDVIDHYCVPDTPKALEILGNIFEIAVHPLRYSIIGAYPDNTTNHELNNLNARLKWDDLLICEENKRFILKSTSIDATNAPNRETANEIIVETLTEFKRMYQARHSINGFTYDYHLIELYAPIEYIRENDEEYRERKIALNMLINSGVITECAETILSNDNGSFLYAICKLNEDKLMGKSVTADTQPITGLPLEIKIVSMPQLETKLVEDDTPRVKKRRGPAPKFPCTDWKNVEIRFLNEQEVFITTDKNSGQTNCEALRFLGEKSDKPNKDWELLQLLAIMGGKFTVSKSPIPQKEKTRLSCLRNRLKEVFKNQTDPFEEFDKSSLSYTLKIRLIPAENVSAPKDIDDYFAEVAPSIFDGYNDG